MRYPGPSGELLDAPIARPKKDFRVSKLAQALSTFAFHWGIVPDDRSETRTYHAAKTSELTYGFGVGNTSADAELSSSLAGLRSRSRQLVRDAAYAQRAKTIIQNNVVGGGINLQAQVMTTREELNDRVNDDIEEQHEIWSAAGRCHTGGALHLADLERAAMGQVFEAGEAFVRLHPVAFGDSAVPLALELVEGERLLTTWSNTDRITGAQMGVIKSGIEVDGFDRALAYYIYDYFPGEPRMWPTEKSNQLRRIPAEQILHLKIIDRWPQTRGVPWMHAVIRKLNDMDGYTEAELIAARGAACYMATIETSPDAQIGESTDVEDTDGEENVPLEPGITRRLLPGEKFNPYSPNRPNSQLDPFMRAMLREAAAGSGVSYESLSRDYSQSNYSSSRLALLDDRDLWRMLQLWFIRGFRMPLYEIWLRQAVLARAIKSIPLDQYAANPRKFSKVLFKPRGWSWIDPTKEVEAAEKAVRCGFDTVTDVIARTAEGRDLEDVLRTRRRELKMMKGNGTTQDPLVFDTDPVAVPATTAAQAQPAAVPGEPSTSGREIIVAAGEMFKDSVVEMQRGFERAVENIIRAVRETAPAASNITLNPSNIVVESPVITFSQQPPEVRVEPQINIEAPDLTVNPPNVNVEPAQVHVSAPEVRVEPQITINTPRKSRKRKDNVEET